MARVNTDVWITSNEYPSSLSSFPEDRASAWPFGDSSTSVQPVIGSQGSTGSPRGGAIQVCAFNSTSLL